MNSILYSAVSALDTFSKGWQVIANNVANVNTDGFKAGSARYENAPGGQGVRLGEIRTDTSPGSPLPGAPYEGRGEYVNEVSEARAAAAGADASAQAASDARASADAAAQAAADARAVEYRESSNVQLEREITQAIITENAFAANAVVISTYDDMMGTVIDIVV